VITSADVYWSINGLLECDSIAAYHGRSAENYSSKRNHAIIPIAVQMSPAHSDVIVEAQHQSYSPIKNVQSLE
jgi:hypothetical protein